MFSGLVKPFIGVVYTLDYNLEFPHFKQIMQTVNTKLTLYINYTHRIIKSSLVVVFINHRILQQEIELCIDNSDGSIICFGIAMQFRLECSKLRKTLFYKMHALYLFDLLLLLYSNHNLHADWRLYSLLHWYLLLAFIKPVNSYPNKSNNKMIFVQPTFLSD